MAESPDLGMRRRVAGLPVPAFDTQPFVDAPPLVDASVAIVTSAGLIRPGEAAWEMQAPSFRVFDSGERDLILGHLSPNFDRSGMAADLNVVYPIDRLAEMERDGVIRALAPRHISFMGAIGLDSLSTIILDTGRAAARILREDGVDVVLLTPV